MSEFKTQINIKNFSFVMITKPELEIPTIKRTGQFNKAPK